MIFRCACLVILLKHTLDEYPDPRVSGQLGLDVHLRVARVHRADIEFVRIEVQFTVCPQSVKYTKTAIPNVLVRCNSIRSYVMSKNNLVFSHACVYE